MEMFLNTTLVFTLVVILLALFFDFTNGFHDSANQVATVIASNALKPTTALLLAAVGEFIGAYFLGTAVAATIGRGIVDPNAINGTSASLIVMIAALLGATTWNLATWYFGMPSSSSHALVGGMLGAFVIGWGVELVNWRKVLEIVGIMLASPLVGFAVTFVFTRVTLLFSGWFSPQANRVYKKLQVASSIAQALSHGTNDAQKTMGVITFALVLSGIYNTPAGSDMMVPDWVILTCSLAIALGTVSGGWRIIKKLGSGLYKVRPLHGFASQAAASLIIYGTAVFGFPVSTTQVISSSVMGAGAAMRFSMVRWLVARDMLMAWLITIPASALISSGLFLVLRNVI